MSLPPGFLDELRQRLTLSQIVGRKVSWDRRKSNPAKGDFWAPCPFHQEKTPSFHVDDRKGFYYCFGCHEKGDIITFVKETDNVSFIEAVEILAREAGVEMPAPDRDPRAVERRDRLSRLAEVMEEAVRLFGLAFRSNAGAAARDYAARRGLDPEILKRFEIGFAPDSRTHQTEAFRNKGVLEDAIAAGLVVRPEDGGAPYDRFRGRLMFPIRDLRGRCIAFGGRALSPDARAKYLNSPETELFHKGRVLFNHGPARDASGKAGTVIVAEGYMDVIALASAGFDHAVAPLGTAITEDQLRRLWQMAAEPVVALDGDEAGLRAAGRLVDLALPLLEPGKSLRFCLMPGGQDPDDLIRSGGREAMARALDGAIPLVEMLWRREVSDGPLDTPERRAEFDQRLRHLLARIGDQTVQAHYRADFRARRAGLFRVSSPSPQRTARSAPAGARQPFGTGPRAGLRFDKPGVPAMATPETLRTELAAKGADSGAQAARIREATILLVACRNHDSIGELESALEEMVVMTPELSSLRDSLVSALAEGGKILQAVERRLGRDPIEFLERVPQARSHPLAREGVDPERLHAMLGEAIGRHQAQIAYEAELAEATRELAGAEGEDWTWRLRQANADLAAALERDAGQTDLEPEAAGVSPIQQMLDAEVYKSKKR